MACSTSCRICRSSARAASSRTAEKQPNSKIGLFYASFMDEAAANQKGAAPVKPWLAEIKAAKDKTALVAEMAKLNRMGVTTPFATGVGQDDKAPDTYIAQFAQDGLGLPDRDYYLKDDPALAKNRAAYVAYVAKLLTLAGEPNADRARRRSWHSRPRSRRCSGRPRIRARPTRPTTSGPSTDFGTKAPGFAWATYLSRSRL